jgi:hypothetical protein
MRTLIKKILRESLETKWNEGNYNYQHGFCHYFAYNIIDRIRELYPNKTINYYMLLANAITKTFSAGSVYYYQIASYILAGSYYLKSVDSVYVVGFGFSCGVLFCMLVKNYL